MHSLLAYTIHTALGGRDRQHILFNRPLQLLYPLDICEAVMLKVTSEDRSVSCHDGPTSDPVNQSGVSISEKPKKSLCVQLPR